MQIQLRIDQKAAVLRGIDAPHSTAKFDLNPADLTEPEREWLASQLYDGYRLDYYGNYKAAAATLAGLKEMIASEFQRVITEKEQESERIRDKVKEMVDSLTQRETKNGRCTVYTNGRAKTVDYSTTYWPHSEEGATFEAALGQVPEARAWLKELHAANERAEQEATTEARRREAQCAAEDKAKAEQAITVATFKRDWIQQHGTDNQRGRLAANLLPEEEVLKSITDAAFASVSQPVYGKITADDVPCACEYGAECAITFNVVDEDESTAEQWEQMETLRTLIPTATITLRRHTGEREDCEATHTRFSLRASAPVGPMTVRRDFACE